MKKKNKKRKEVGITYITTRFASVEYCNSNSLSLIKLNVLCFWANNSDSLITGTMVVFKRKLLQL
jgi:hypothetical protein